MIINAKIKISDEFKTILGNQVVICLKNINSEVADISMNIDAETAPMVQDFVTGNTLYFGFQPVAQPQAAPIQQQPPAADVPVQTLFNSNANLKNEQADSLPSRIAKVVPSLPTKRNTVVAAPVEPVDRNDIGSEDNGDEVSYISSTAQFYQEVTLARNKRSDIDIDSITDPRQRAIALEQKEAEESLDMPAWVVNEKFSSISISDLNLQLNLNAPIDMSRYSAKRLAASHDLKMLLKKGWLRFISPDDAEAIRAQYAQEQLNDTVEVYDRDEAEARLQRKLHGRAPMTSNDIDDADDDAEVIDLSHDDDGDNMIDLTPRVANNGAMNRRFSNQPQSRRSVPTNPAAAGVSASSRSGMSFSPIRKKEV